MTNNLIIKLIKLQDKLNISILKIAITQEQLIKLKIKLKKEKTEFLLINKWKNKKNCYAYGGIEIKIK